MLKQELIHSHILVAIFCGWEAQKPRKEFPNGCVILNEEEEVHIVSNDTILEDLPYTTDWNYLMVAYDKFRDAAEEQDEEGFTKSDTAMEIRDSLIEAILAVNIDLAFKELVRGISTINELKLQE